MSSPALDVANLARDYSPGITRAVGDYLVEAAAVCFDSQNHASGVQLETMGTFNGMYEVICPEVTRQMRRAHGDFEVATEYGAYAVSILLIALNTGLSVIERSRKGTGFDYWLGDADTSGLPFQHKARLEVSGIRHGTESDVESRVRQKRRQISAHENPLPAYVVVVEFGRPMARIAVNDDDY